MPSHNYMTSLRLVPMNDEQAAQLVERMLGSYPSFNAHDPKIYIAELVTILTRYPDWVGEKAIAAAKRESPKFVPTAPELEAACEEAIGTVRTSATYASQWDERTRMQLEERARIEASQCHRPQPDPVPKGYLCNVFVPPTAPQYQAMVERSQKAPLREWYVQPGRAGIWVPMGWLDEAKSTPSRGFRQYTGDELRAMYPAKPQEGAA